MNRRSSSTGATRLAMSNAEAAGVNVVAQAHARLGLHARFESLYRQKEKVRPLAAEEPEFWRDQLTGVGYRSVAEFVAEGYLPAEFAKVNGIPLIYFFDWWNNCPKDLLRVAHQAHAQTNALKAEMVLSLQPPDKESAEIMKESAKLHMDRAKVFDPGLWQQKPLAQQNTAPVVFNFGGNLRAVDAMKVVNTVAKTIPMSEMVQSAIPTFAHMSVDDLPDEPYYDGEE